MKNTQATGFRLLQHLTEWIFQHRLWALSIFIFIQYSLAATNGLWYGDFWEHSAVVNELMLHPFRPHHPQLKIDVSHVFFNPYALLVAATGLLFKIDAITALAIFGAINFLILVYGLRSFISTANQQSSSEIAFYTLLLAMFLWSNGSWLFSGFYNFKIINDILPYPSTLALGLSLVALRLQHTFLNRPINSSWLSRKSLSIALGLILISSIILLIHPITALFLWTGLACQLFSGAALKNIWHWLGLGAIVILSIAIASMWPYFSIIQLMLKEGAAYHLANSSMYLGVLQNLWPVLITTPFIIQPAISRSYRAILLILLVLLFLYCWGYFSQHYSYGRCITFVILLANMLFAQTLVRAEQWLISKPLLLPLFKGGFACFLTIIASVWLYQMQGRLLTIANSIYLGRPISSQIGYKHLMFLKDYVGHDEVVLADIASSWILPTIAGKATATTHPLAFVPEWWNRKMAVIEFFEPNTSSARRNEILRQFKPQYLLINKAVNTNWPALMNQYLDSAEQNVIVAIDGEMILIRIGHL